MKKVIAATLIAGLSLPVLAGGPHHGGYHHHHHARSGWGWVAPAIIGGAVVYAATHPVYAYPPQPPVIVQNPLPPAPLGYRYEVILDAGCNCYRQVLIPN